MVEKKLRGSSAEREITERELRERGTERERERELRERGTERGLKERAERELREGLKKRAKERD